MTVFRFDGTFEGLLTAVFESFRLQVVPDRIEGRVPAVPDLFEEIFEIATDESGAKRVWRKVCAKSSKETAFRLYMVFLSGLPEAPGLIYRYICHMMASPHNIDTDFTNPAVWAVADIHRKVARETHRVHMFTRFQQTAENTFYASVAPRYDVLPLATAHFRDRFAEAEWVIYDLARNYGIFHRNGTAERITFTEVPAGPGNGNLREELLHPDETAFRALWKDYYQSATIAERKNVRLQRQRMPVRFWQYLTEKQ